MKRILALFLVACMLATGAFAQEAVVEETPAAAEIVENTVEPTKAPENTLESPSADPTEAPVVEPTAGPTLSVIDSSTTQPQAMEPGDNALVEIIPVQQEITTNQIPEDAEAWMEDPDNPGQILYGLIEDLIADFDEDTEAVVYMLTDENEIIKVLGKTLDDVKKAVFLPDPDKYEENKYVVQLSETDPTELDNLADKQPGDGAVESALYIWVEKKQGPKPTDPPTQPELDIIVDPGEAYLPNEWSNARPVFTLSGIPDGEEGYSYEAILYGERYVPLRGNTYEVSMEGEDVTVRFVVVDKTSQVVARSREYTMMLDFTNPTDVLAELEEEGGATFRVTAQDALSGIKEYTVDGGQTWFEADEEGGYTHTGTLGEVYAQGMIRARDFAGNISEYAAEFAIPEPEPEPDPYPNYVGGGGGGSGDGDGTTSIKHVSGDADADPYDALVLDISDEPMNKLVIGGQELDLSLELDSAESLDLDALVEEDEEYVPTFTACLAK